MLQEVLIGTGLAVGGLGLVGCIGAVHQLTKQQGRLLVRLGALEQAARMAKRLPGEKPLSESRIERNGLRPGVPAPTFELPDLNGGTVSLQAFRGRPLLLVFTDPHCGPCDALAPRLNRLARAHANNGLAVVMVGRGDPDENRRKVAQHGLVFPVALQHHWEISKQFGIFGTPVGFLVDAQGVVVREVGKGVEGIMALVDEAGLVGQGGIQ